MKRICIFVLLTTLLSEISYSQQVTIKGNAKSYAGETLFWNGYDDQISFTQKEFNSTQVDKDGNFQFRFNISETQLSFIYLNVFKGILYIEPGKEYEVVLPQKINKLPEDELNPYFEETEFNIRVLNAPDNELNELIKNFNKQYDNYLSRYFQQFKGKISKQIVDSIIFSIDESIPEKGNNYFNEYKEYSYAALKLLSYERNKEKLINSYFTGKPVLYQNPAYMDLFNQLFSNYLSYYSKTKQGKQIPYYLIKEKSLKNIKHCLAESSSLKDSDLQDLIICKSLLDNFYKDDFPQESIIFMLDSVKLAGNSQNRFIADNILKKITSLRVNFPAPDFELPDINNKMDNLGTHRNKFVYLSFINPKSYTCLQELQILKKMQEQNLEMFQIISICVSDNMEQMKQLVIGNGYNWPFLYFSKNLDLLKAYNIYTYPTYYLINPEGKLAMSPAFPPSEPTFGKRYSDILSAWKTELEQRKLKSKSKN